MFCPQCGSTQGDDVKFCKLCGANLQAVRQAVTARDGEKIDWSKTWVAEMFLSGEEHRRRKEEMERRRGITPEVKRYREIKAGVIVSSLSVALMIFLMVLMNGIIAGGQIPDDMAEILSRVWVAGLIPLFVGLALVFNGLFVSKRIVEAARRGQPAGMTSALEGEAERPALRPADTTEFVPTSFSVTEDPTKHLGGVGRKQ